MKFSVKLTEEAQKDYLDLNREQQNLLQADYKLIRSVGLEAVKYRSLDKNLFEIKTDNLPSLYNYRKGQLIIVAVIFIKKTQKTPRKEIERAKKILKNN